MARESRILLIGDSASPMHSALASASPRSEITTTPTVFDAITELTAGEYTAVFCPAEPIERRPESAVSTLRTVAGEAKLILFSHPTLEPLSRRMLNFGSDDYLVTPPEPREITEILNRTRHAVAQQSKPQSQTPDEVEVSDSAQSVSSAPSVFAAEARAQRAEARVENSSSFDATIFLDAHLNHPLDAPSAAITQLNRSLAPMRISLLPGHDNAPPAADGFVAFSQPLDRARTDSPTLYLQTPRHHDESASRQLLEKLAAGFVRLTALQDRFLHLKKLATTDELTGLANMRWFREKLIQIMETSRKRKAPVTLLLFDIDDFKKYNDRYGHGVGDEILKQTAQLMRLSVREHDIVARIGGDEFAVIFWENQGPRTVRDPHAEPEAPPGRPPQTPAIMCKRFQSLLSKHTFSHLGSDGKGSLTISGGLATYPWDGANPEDLIAAADKALMFGAKRSGKNSIALVGEDHST